MTDDLAAPAVLTLALSSAEVGSVEQERVSTIDGGRTDSLSVTTRTTDDPDAPPLRLTIGGRPVAVPRQVIAAAAQSAMPDDPTTYHAVRDGNIPVSDVLRELWVERPAELVDAVVRHALAGAESSRIVERTVDPPTVAVELPEHLDPAEVVALVSDLDEARAGLAAATGLQPPDVQLRFADGSTTASAGICIGPHLLPPLPPRVVADHLVALWFGMPRTAVATGTIERWWTSWSGICPVTAGLVEELIDRPRLFGLIERVAHAGHPLVEGHRIIESLLRHHGEPDEELLDRIAAAAARWSAALAAEGRPSGVVAWEVDDELLHLIESTAPDAHDALAHRLSSAMAGGRWVTVTSTAGAAGLQSLLRRADLRHVVLGADHLPTQLQLETVGPVSLDDA